MKILLIDCSPERKIEETSLVLNPFIEGIIEAGGEVETFYADKMDIQPCNGCLEKNIFDPHCECRCTDDMCQLYPRFKESDVWVFATPSESERIEASMINILDRMSPLFAFKDSSFDLKNGFDSILGSKGKIVLISTSYAWGLKKFDSILDHFHTITSLFSRDFAGSVLRPHYGAFAALNNLNGPIINDIFESVKEAGKEIVLNGKISEEIQSNISRPLVPEDSFLVELSQMLNQ